MTFLQQAADTVENAWCKGDLIREAESRDEGNTYCAVGALAVAAMPEGFGFTTYGDKIGPLDTIQSYTTLRKEFAKLDDHESERANEIRGILDDIRYGENWFDTYEFMDTKEEVQMLARVIIETYPDRTGVEPDSYAAKRWIETDPTTMIVRFNDQDKTTRQEVIDMMLLADQRMNEA